MYFYISKLNNIIFFCSFLSYTITVCEQLENGVTAVFGAPSIDGAHAIRAVCNSMDVPFIATQEDGSPIHEDNTFNVYPNDMYISEALKDLVKHYGWHKITILYEDEDGEYFSVFSFVSIRH